MYSLTLLLAEAETEDGSDEEAVEGEYYNAKTSKKKGRKKEERQAQRQVQYIHLVCSFRLVVISCFFDIM